MERKEKAKKNNGSAPRVIKAPKSPKPEKKRADELMMEAWKYTYETRHRRLTKP